MCFCCCTKRQTINTFLLIMTLIIFIYSSITISQHASKTLLYETFENRLESINHISSRTTPSENYNHNNNRIRRINSANDDLNNYILQNYRQYVNSIKDANSYYYISNFDYYQLEGKKYDILEVLRRIENGFGITFIVLHILFLIFIIVFLCNSCGDKEYTLSTSSTFYSLLRIKTICIILSILLILLSLVYSILLSVALIQYIQFIKNVKIDTFIEKIIIGVSYGLYSCYYYITLSCGICAEKNIFFQLGYEGNPGQFAKFHKDGTPIKADVSGPSSQNILVFNNKKKKISDEPPLSKDPINAEEIKIEESNLMKKKNKTVLNHDENRQQKIIFSSSKDGKYLYYNGETYMKVNTTISNPSN